MVVTYKRVRKRRQKEWWIEIHSKGNKSSSSLPLTEPQGSSEQLIIYGEPRTWWEQRLKEPKAQSFLAQLQEQRVYCTMTNSHIQITANTLPRYKAAQWQYLLNEAPPTSKDWKNSEIGRGISAKHQNALAVQSGAPVTVSPLRAAKRALSFKNMVKESEKPVSCSP
mgnify:CR=1 FL=1